MDGPDGLPIRYDWVVVTRPEGSVSRPLESFNNPREPENGGEFDDGATPMAFFYTDVAGEYVLELRVTDHFGLSTLDCNHSASVRISAR